MTDCSWRETDGYPGPRDSERTVSRLARATIKDIVAFSLMATLPSGGYRDLTHLPSSALEGAHALLYRAVPRG